MEFILTGVLLVVILGLANARNSGAPGSNLAPVFVGLAVTALVGIGAPLTMACMNPARDLGPRLFAYLAGFGGIAFPGPKGHEFWLFTAAPISGALFGTAVYSCISAVKEREKARAARA